MKFAIASQNFRTVTAHAGKTRRFLLFEGTPGSEPVETGRLDLPRELAFHDFAGGPHPLDEVDVVIAGSAGPGFIARMRERGVHAVATGETDPRTAVAAYLGGALRPAAAHEECGHHG
ncbi:NifB/NifX family molybdenum-iron cluster-binding protein [Azospirillum thermophilum]|uniref:Nitrogen fixation protein n=1 Tax=Azospirillum thermophilum TaxID=2202148 RepID=A0A2S2CMY4_9PROT|nr:NifB/NifX family molybdenum-iron cluster-binding protein [Azospirillum thermophilum]AWK85805.1 nitrogen fixation protein [Azospirillum thermophilum]